MADSDQQGLKKRKSSDLSSISELDTSSTSPRTDTRRKKKKSKGASDKSQTESNKAEQLDRDTGRKASEEMNT